MLLPTIRTTQEIKDEITRCVGFFPPYFIPALESPSVLENLWQQALSAYLTNTIPPVFKEKLGAMLGLYMAVPYCLLCHASTLGALSVSGSEILKVLNREMPDLEGPPLKLQFLKKLPSDVWPESGSDLEDVLLEASVVAFFEQDDGLTTARLKEILPLDFFNHLLVLLAYNRASMLWIKAHPQISYREDQRYLSYFQRIVDEEPALDSYFQSFLVDAAMKKRRPSARIKESSADRRKIVAERDFALELLRREKD